MQMVLISPILNTAILFIVVKIETPILCLPHFVVMSWAKYYKAFVPNLSLKILNNLNVSNMVMNKFSFQNETSPQSTGTSLSFLHFISLKTEPQVFLSVFLSRFMVHNASWGYRYNATKLTGREDNCARSRSLSSTSNPGLIPHTV